MLVTRHWTIIHNTGRTVHMSGAFAGRASGMILPVVSAVCKLVSEDGKEYAGYAYEALLDADVNQMESLLSVHQSLQLQTIGIDDRARCEADISGRPGTQSARFQQYTLPFFFDGIKCFYAVAPITKHELQILPAVHLTDGSRPFDPRARLHSRRTSLPNTDPQSLFRWKSCLGFIPDEVVKHTLSNTTQLVRSVDAENRELMRDHFQTRFPQLKLRRLNDTCYVDTFFSSVTSIRGFRCWNLFSFKKSGLDVVYLLRQRSHSPSTLPELVTECGVPAILKSDNAPEFKSTKWTSFLRSHCIRSQFTEAYHPNQNLSERRGGTIKAATVHLLTVTQAPKEYWCYALEFIALVRSCIAKRSLNWKTPHEMHFGDTPDISVFRFVFWQPVWYYSPTASFPNPRMLKGRFLGISPNTGDAFCFRVLTEPDDPSTETPVVIARSVIRARTEIPVSSRTLLRNMTDANTRVNAGLDTALDFRALTNSQGDEPPDPCPEEDIPPSYFTDPTNSMQQLRSYLSQDGTPSADPFQNGFLEVYGPRSSVPVDVLDQDTAEQATPISNEVPLTFPPHSNTSSSVSDNTMHQISSDIEPLATDPIPTTDVIILPTSPSPLHPDVPEVTQDDDEVELAVQDEIAHAIVEDVNEDDQHFNQFDSIISHDWKDGILHFEVRWKTLESSFIPFSLLKRDYPKALAEYILVHKLGSPSGTYNTTHHNRWARSFLRQLKKTVRRFIRLNNLQAFIHPDSNVWMDPELPTDNTDGRGVIRRLSSGTTPNKKKRRKPGRTSRPITVKYGVVIPTSITHAKQLDADNGNTFWMDAVRTEIESLLKLQCFEFLAPMSGKPSSDYQFTKLTMIFDVKQDGRRKARLVAGGHLIDPMGINARSTVVKGISVRLLDIIAHRDGLSILCGDIGNAFVTAPCMEKVYSIAGPEFEERRDSTIIIKKALYGLRSSSRAFRAYFADYLRSLGFFPVRYDRDVWMQLRPDKTGYDYICTHVDDFKIVAKDPQFWMDKLSSKFLLKSVGPPKYYLGNDYRWHEPFQAWVTNCSTYLDECIQRIERDPYFDGKLFKHNTPIPEEEHPEMDDSDFLDETGIRKYQMLIGMAQWACTIGRLDISFAVSSLSRFSANPRQGHLILALHLFGYLKKYSSRSLVMNSLPLDIAEELRQTSFHPDFLEDYPDAAEEIGNNYPTPYGRELQTSVFFDADHAHDHKTRRSISGLIVFVGSTPVSWSSKRQGCIATSTYCAEFVSMRSAVEEAISIRYYLRCLGVPITNPTNLYGDNFGVIQSASLANGELKKKHIAISYHYVREAISAKIVNAIWIKTDENFSDINTKALGPVKYQDFVKSLME